MIFKDRKDAGIRLSERLGHYRNRKDTLVIALPRGGVVTGYEIADRLNLHLDVLIVRKLGFPGEPELAMGAVSETGAVHLDRHLISLYRITDEFISGEINTQQREIARRIELYRGGRKLEGLGGNIIILVDDGVATGSTMKAAIMTLKQEDITKLVIALPVAPPATAAELEKLADEFVCLSTSPYFISVGSFYEDFTQVTDDEVKELLRSPEISGKGIQ